MNEQSYIERYWRDATPADAIKDPPMVARFRDINCPWKINTLRGVRQGVKFPWFSESKGSFQHCQVYDAPDPGEGWRLIDTENEKPEVGDQYFSGKKWIERPPRINLFCRKYVYRRNVCEITYKPFTANDCDELRGRWVRRVATGFEIMVTQLSFTKTNRLRINAWSAKEMCRDFVFVDTGKPVGKEVAQ